MGIVLLIHPTTGDVATITARDTDKRATFEYLVRDGYQPVGPRARALAVAILKKNQVTQ